MVAFDFVVAEIAARFYRCRRHPIGWHDAFGNMRRLGERRIDHGLVAMGRLQHHIVAQIRMDERGVGIERARRDHVGGQRLIFDVDRFRRIEGEMAGLSHHHGDTFADITRHAVDREEGAIDGVRRLTAHIVNRPDAFSLAVTGIEPILPGEHGQDARNGQRTFLRNADNPGVRVRAAHIRRVNDTFRQGDIVHILAGAGQKLFVFASFDRLANIHGCVRLPRYL